MPKVSKTGLLSLLLVLQAGSFCVSAVLAGEDSTRPPSQLFRELYARVEEADPYADSKTFADAVPKESPQHILRLYRRHPCTDHACLAEFVAAHFKLPDPAPDAVDATGPRLSLSEHIRQLWPALVRQPALPAPWSSLLAFDRRYVVPGGRFGELYYWDSYFTMLGLVRDGRADLTEDMVAGFAGLIRRYGHVPNGTRTYYLSRSQPPFFYLMVGLLDPADPAAAYRRYLPALRREYAYWTGAGRLPQPGTASGHVVRMADGSVLERYWDERAAPRDESFLEDLRLAQRSGRPAAELYRDLRAAAESGWDFSSRWLADGRDLATIRTTAIVPVDLNSLLYGMEKAIAHGCGRGGDASCAAEFEARAEARRRAIERYLWQPQAGTYEDYDWRSGQPTGVISAAALYPLFTQAANATQGAAVAATVRTELLAPGGLDTTPYHTGQQWDAPNGWAPLQWIAVCGLKAYGEADLAQTIASRWLRSVQRVYDADGRLVEKYNVETLSVGGGGEYPLQDGFGWTNGVTRALLDQYKPAPLVDGG